MFDDRNDWVQIKRGAEASVWKMTFADKKCVAKVAEPKLWRAKELDIHLRGERLQNEARTNLKCMRLGIPIAPILYIDRPTTTLIMEELSGPTVKQLLFDSTDDSSDNVIRAMEEMGKIIARMHENDLVHSDLTTSNFMLHNGSVRIIDFGLSFVSTLNEDKAVDLYVLERAFASSHPGKENLLQIVLETYQKEYIKSPEVMKRLKKVRSRGRKRSMVG
ncbi:TKL family protein kinase [Tritrichomonas foetus]|uniref:non-specific serine/threonine protein kinase n=1 Tax=Tritrichomonas foetus TaxID=1144522 RepID=A0A1J4KW74_9EUKA|nr:TKL family protein kinase [Tritrichomonas foetus]|eukprot:OHT15394.1 TKL family protein kinase [Tritrichomonas foetus]